MTPALSPEDEKWSPPRTLAYIASYSVAAWTLLGVVLALMAILLPWLS